MTEPLIDDSATTLFRKQLLHEVERYRKLPPEVSDPGPDALGRVLDTLDRLLPGPAIEGLTRIEAAGERMGLGREVPERFQARHLLAFAARALAEQAGDDVDDETLRRWWEEVKATIIAPTS